MPDEPDDEVIDGRLVGGVRLSARRRAGFDAAVREPGSDGAWQVSSIRALIDGRYDGDLTLGELVAHGDLGLGTCQHLDGELVVLDGRCWQIRADGTVHEPPTTMRTPFAVVCRFAPGPPAHLAGPLGIDGLAAALDDLSPPDEPLVAVRVDGTFRDLVVRSVPRQHPPYPPLTDVVEHQTTWRIPQLTGTVVGFRFPAALEGIEVPGHHLHVLSDDRTAGGHVVDLVLEDGVARVDGEHALHLEVPPGVTIHTPASTAASAEAIRRVEGRPS